MWKSEPKSEDGSLPRYTLRRRVSLESRYGAWAIAELARALMHMPSIVRLLLMLLASSARSPAAHAHNFVCVSVIPVPAACMELPFMVIESPQCSYVMSKI